MTLQERIQQDTIAAMKERAQLKLDVLRMVKSAVKNKEIEKREPLTEPEVLQTLTTLIKQRRDSVEAFTKGNRPELAEKEAAEIKIIEAYMPQQADESKVRSFVEATIAEMSSAGKRPTPKEMGLVIKDVQAKIAATGLRADGKVVSEIVKAELAEGMLAIDAPRIEVTADVELARLRGAAALVLQRHSGYHRSKPDAPNGKSIRKRRDRIAVAARA